jgi:hypothetical protein
MYTVMTSIAVATSELIAVALLAPGDEQSAFQQSGAVVDG